MIINNKRIWLGLFIGIVMSFSVYGQNINAEKITVPDSKLTNLYQIDSGVYRSEQPSDADFKALEKYGISEDQLINALRIIKNRKGPIVFHCHHGSDRTGAVCAMYRIVFQGVSKQKAIQEMTEGGFGFHRIYKNIIRTIEKADIERIKREVLQ